MLETDPPSQSHSNSTNIERPENDAEAARFLLQAQFAASDADIAAVRRDGYADWIGSQFTRPLGQLGCAWLTERGHNGITQQGTYFWTQMGDFMIWNQLLTAQDQMR